MEEALITIQQFFTIDRVLSIIGIGITVIVALYIYKIQQRAQRTIDKINKLFDAIAKRRITWFDGHVGGLLRSLRIKCEELYERVETYQKEKSRENLIAVVIAGSNIKSKVDHLYSLYERDIELAKDYISDPYMVGKFKDVIQILGWGMDPTETEVRTMDLAKFKNDIQDRIEEIQGYIDRVEEEVRIVNS